MPAKTKTNRPPSEVWRTKAGTFLQSVEDAAARCRQVRARGYKPSKQEMDFVRSNAERTLADAIKTLGTSQEKAAPSIAWDKVPEGETASESDE